MTYELVLRELQEYANPEKRDHFARFFKNNPGEYGEGDKFLGIAVPNQRKVAKKYNEMPLSEVEKLLRSKFHECRLTAVMLLVYRIEKKDQDVVDEVAEFYLKNIEYVNNWDIVDSSCRFILARFLEKRERDLLYDLAKSDNLWERRIAIITCYYFIKNDDFEDALAISKLLLYDGHDLIHKAVGWMLREIGGQDQLTEEAFLLQEDHYKKMPRTMLRYAIEKFDEPLRKKYLSGSI
ncbi:MAG: DNA alkylation repair protein [Balneolaceae bacterium]|nr:DNA alkylation repair protein [Balneolaceae bacterium]MBO6547006.1 DNA alkylation repair protein [Balneolaceae bacterium]MBO6649366.1 DNA alkylation repair protein [Balneolaceae bacterium]